jgi:hypothetical protein
MTVGLPGVGLGGIFYLVSAALMPVRELVRAFRRERPARWSLVWRQSAMVAGILGALWLTGWLLGIVIATSPMSLATPAHVTFHSSAAHNVLRVSALALSLGTLVLVLSSVQIARLFVKRPDRASVTGVRAIGETREIPTPISERAPSSGTQRMDSGTFGRARK